MISEHVGPTSPQYSDCASDLQRLRKAQRQEGPQGHLTRGALYEGIHPLTNFKTPRPVRWLRSHPEKRKAGWHEFTVEEAGSYVADKVARGQSDQLPIRCPGFRIPISLVTPFFTANNEWHLTKAANPSQPLLSPISKYVNEARLSRYLSRRDQYRLQDGRPPTGLTQISPWRHGALQYPPR